MKVMVIAAGLEQERIIQLVKERGHWVLATAWPATYADSLTLADHGEIVDPRNLTAIWELAHGHAIEAVVTDQCDYSQFAAAYVAERKGLPGPSFAAAHVAINKSHQRGRLRESGVLQPRYVLCATRDDVWKAVKNTGYPAIIKPVDNRGNSGVNRIDHEEHVAEAYYDAIANTLSRKIIVEQFIEGTMVTVEGFVFPCGQHISLVSSSKVMLGGRKRVAMELRYPAEFPKDIVESVIETNQKAMQALGYGFGPTHAEYMVTPSGQAYFIEAANRGGGVLINSHIVPAVTRCDPTSLMVDHATRIPVELQDYG